MKTSSAKAKGRRACLEMKTLLHLYFPELKDDDVQVASSGSNGEDILLSPFARSLFNFSTEVKNQEKVNIWEAYSQALEHQAKRPESRPLLVFKRNKSELMACVDLMTFLRLVSGREPGLHQR